MTTPSHTGLYKIFFILGKCTMARTNIDSYWMSNASSGLCIIYIMPIRDVTAYTSQMGMVYFVAQ